MIWPHAQTAAMPLRAGSFIPAVPARQALMYLPAAAAAPDAEPISPTRPSHAPAVISPPRFAPGLVKRQQGRQLN